MPKKSVSLSAPPTIEAHIHFVHGQRVMLDSDLARLYGVTTKALNQAVNRNRDRFPEDFMFTVGGKELEGMRSQNVTSKPGRGGRRNDFRVFTQEGVAPKKKTERKERAPS